MHPRISPRVQIGVLGRCGLALLLAGCLDRNAGQNDPTLPASSTSSGPGSDGSTTYPGIMTTTVDPGHGDSDSGSTTDAGPDPCGNGKIDPPELCDQGEANADDAECTSACRWNVCGDGLIKAGDELCDDGKHKNGKYGQCGRYCDDWAPRCGDSMVQADEGETCDDPNPHYGCLADCSRASSCLEIKNSFGDAVPTGLYVLRREDLMFTAWCDMEADGGGYSFLKYASGTVLDLDTFLPQPLTAAEAEQKCATWGLRLLAPRSDRHLRAAFIAASATDFGAVHDTGDYTPNLDVDSDVAGYLSILGIYPVTPGQSCVGKPLNSEDCPQWALKPDPANPDLDQPYWVSDKIFAGQPGTTNCAGCSLFYDWKLDVQPPVLTGYFAFPMNGKGASSSHFLCEVGDKLGPPT
ncbi:fibrinogen-like YCDxxxxGGGW domain-containing protein [Nannocystis bainbridge]|uniref:Fibrinogen-like YCDxxxxGGGW domain-containing protein n=1 Tax=Nannocystis bainbridge TaxID=2995303 RepID=A0ABT5EA32_9BACT|nr:fibrinogen-like YCDxxxxGGGW domain-containing protein [Nannocystis bainbridge]MDC0722706.1 fibrinogen-like YCDxxxxGGGW domain-containing protein [Nannocystis bainbridge]